MLHYKHDSVILLQKTQKETPWAGEYLEHSRLLFTDMSPV